MHAAWNAVVKVQLERFLAVALVMLVSGFICLLLVPFVPLPLAAAWPWLIVSSVVHCLYCIALARAYHMGDLGQVYPLARGGAPLLIFIGAVVTHADTFSPVAGAGVACLTFGICLIAPRSGRSAAHVERRTVGYALATSVCIAGYTLLDGVGAQVNKSPHSFAVWLHVIHGLMMLVLVLAVRGKTGVQLMATGWKQGLAAGSLSLAAYWVIIWAMTVAPISLVGALRETSVLFAALISTVVLRERLSAARIAAACIIVVGVVVMRFG